jgi:hypothetical protein
MIWALLQELGIRRDAEGGHELQEIPFQKSKAKGER